MAIWSAPEDAGYTLNRTVQAPATLGRTQTVLAAAPMGRWDRGPALRVKLGSGQLASASEVAVLNGAIGLGVLNVVLALVLYRLLRSGWKLKS